MSAIFILCEFVTQISPISFTFSISFFSTNCFFPYFLNSIFDERYWSVILNYFFIHYHFLCFLNKGLKRKKTLSKECFFFKFQFLWITLPKPLNSESDWSPSVMRYPEMLFLRAVEQTIQGCRRKSKLILRSWKENEWIMTDLQRMAIFVLQ